MNLISGDPGELQCRVTNFFMFYKTMHLLIVNLLLNITDYQQLFFFEFVGGGGDMSSCFIFPWQQIAQLLYQMRLEFVSELYLENHSAFCYRIWHMYCLLTQQVPFACISQYIFCIYFCGNKFDLVSNEVCFPDIT